MGIAKREGATTKSPGVPKIALVVQPAPYSIPKGQVEASQIDVMARMTELQKLHNAYVVTGAVCLGNRSQDRGHHRQRNLSPGRTQ
jgi:2-methylaconitate cis-trans-isomerase PrpF